MTVSIESIKSMAGNDLMTVRGEVHAADGAHVVTSLMMLVARAPEEG